MTLDGSGSSDPDGNALTYQWRNINGVVLGTTALLPVTLGPGEHLLTLNVTDPSGLFSEDNVLLSVEPEPNAAPVANAGPDQTVTTDTPPIKVTLDGTASTDSDGDLMALRWKSDTGQVLIGSSRELVGWDASINPRLVRRMLQRARDFMPALANVSDLRTWTGFRPATPDHLALIGPWDRTPGAWVAAGHEGLGITSALGTARLLADLIAGRAPELDPTAYAPTRASAARSTGVAA